MGSVLRVLSCAYEWGETERGHEGKHCSGVDDRGVLLSPSAALGFDVDLRPPGVFRSPEVPIRLVLEGHAEVERILVVEG